MSRLALQYGGSAEYRGAGLTVELGRLLQRVVSPKVFPDYVHCGEDFTTAHGEDGCTVPVRLDCNRAGCPTHEFIKHKTAWMKSTEDVWRFYEASGFRVSFMRIVGTFPDYLRLAAYALPEKVLRGMLIRTLERLYSDGGRYQLFYMVANHYWSTADPLSGPVPHLDCNLFNVAYDRLNGCYTTIRLGLPKDGLDRPSLELARRCWLEELESHFVRFHSSDVDISFKGPRYGWSHVAQAVKYSLRPPVRDLLDWMKGHSVPKDVDLNWVRDLVLSPRRKRQSYVWGGCFSNAVRRRAQDALRFQLRSRREFEHEMKQLFCEHGYPLVRDFSSPPIGMEEIRRLGLKFPRWLEDVPPWERSS
jgi:hypothetical protein